MKVHSVSDCTTIAESDDEPRQIDESSLSPLDSQVSTNQTGEFSRKEQDSSQKRSHDENTCVRCGHTYVENCLIQWFSIWKKNTCPSCIKKASKGEILNFKIKRLITVEEMKYHVLHAKIDTINIQMKKAKMELRKKRGAVRFLIVKKYLRMLESNSLLLQKNYSLLRHLRKLDYKNAGMKTI